MLKKTLTAVAIAGALLFTGAAGANAAGDYPVGVTVTAGSATITVGGSTTVTATGLGELETVYFGTDGTPGGSVSSIVRAAGTGPVAKPVVDGSASATFTASAAGTFTIAVSDGETVLGTTTVTVAAAGSGGGGTLPATGSEIPAAAIWLGAGAIGIGGIAIAAAVARRRAATNR
jgi:LPXTG-motif cell wall-anchored protein